VYFSIAEANARFGLLFSKGEMYLFNVFQEEEAVIYKGLCNVNTEEWHHDGDWKVELLSTIEFLSRIMEEEILRIEFEKEIQQTEKRAGRTKKIYGDINKL
jgi:hypothetical protein